MEENVVEEIKIKGNNIIRIYSIEEFETYFPNRKYVSAEELINVNLMQFLMQRQDKIIKNEGKTNKIKEFTTTWKVLEISFWGNRSKTKVKYKKCLFDHLHQDKFSSNFLKVLI